MHRLSRILSVCTLLLAFALFVHNLDVQSIWRDEALSILRARQSIAGIFQSRNIVQGVDSPDLHPPLYFLFLHGWRAVLGEATFLWRYPSVLFMLMAFAVITAVSQKIAGGNTGLRAGLLLLVSPFCWWYAQETRMYALVVLLGALFLFSWWNLLSRLDRVRTRDWVFFSIAAAALMYTHYVSVFLVAAAVATLLWWKMSKRLILVLLCVAVVVIVPLQRSLGVMLVQRFKFIESRTLGVLLFEPLTTFWLGTTVPPTALLPVEKFYLFLPWAVLLLLAFAGWALLKKEESIWRWLPFSLGGILLTVFVAWLVGFVVPNYSNPRHLTALFPLVYVVLAVGLTIATRINQIFAAVLLLSVIFIGGSALAQEIDSPEMVRDDVDGIRAYLEPRVRSGDLILWHDPDVAVAWDYYALPDVPHDTLPRMFQDWALGEADLQSYMETYDRIWFIDSYGRSTNVSERLETDWLHDSVAFFEGSWIYPSMTLYRNPQSNQAMGQVYAFDAVGGETVDLVTLTSDEAFVSGDGVWFEIGWDEAAVNCEQAPNASTCLATDERLTGLNTLYLPIVARDLSEDGWFDAEWDSAMAEEICVQLIDSAEKQHARSCTSTDGRISPVKMLYLPLPAGMPPIDYRLQLSVGENQVEIDTVRVEMADAMSLQPLETFNESTLLAVNWDAERFTANNWAIGSLVWQIDTVVDAFSAEIRLTNRFGQAVTDSLTIDDYSVDYPPSEWKAGDVVSTDFALRLPFELDGLYRLQVRASAQSPWRSVASIDIDPVSFERALPDDVQPLAQEVAIAEDIVLAAQTLRREGDQLVVDLYWRMNGSISAEYQTFIHLARPGEPPLAQSGGIPVGNSRPTNTWRDGELIHDSYTLDASALEENNDLVILIGMFDPESGARPELTVDGQAQPDNAWNAGAAP